MYEKKKKILELIWGQCEDSTLAGRQEQRSNNLVQYSIYVYFKLKIKNKVQSKKKTRKRRRRRNSEFKYRERLGWKSKKKGG